MEATLERIKAIFLDNLRRYVEGRTLRNQVRCPPLTYLGGLGKIHLDRRGILRIRRLPMKKADKNLLSGSTTLLVLSLLSSGDKYGYEMIAELEARSDHTFTLKEGTLYPILHTLEKDGAVKSYEKEAPTGRMRKYYRITRKGLRLLDEKKEEWVEFTHTVNAILAGTSPALA